MQSYIVKENHISSAINEILRYRQNILTSLYNRIRVPKDYTRNRMQLPCEIAHDCSAIVKLFSGWVGSKYPSRSVPPKQLGWNMHNFPLKISPKTLQRM